MASARTVLRIGMSAALLAALSPAAAAPLCRDSKGLFTPCPRAANKTAQAIIAAQPVFATVPARDVETVREPTAHRVRESGPIHHTRLCTDTRGLFTPCPR